LNTPVLLSILASATVLVAGCARQPEPAPAPDPAAAGASASVTPRGETEPGLEDDGNDVAFWLHPDDAARSLVLVSGGTAGLELFGLDGRRVGGFAEGEFDYVDVSYGFQRAGSTAPLVVAYDRQSGGLVVLAVDPVSGAVSRVSSRTLDTGGEVTGLCTYRSALTGRHYAFASVDGGQLQQWELFARDDEVDGRLIRTLPIGSGAGYCAVDGVTGELYVAEETVGIWRLAAEPETDAERTAIDLVAPFGRIAEEVKGLAVYRVDDSSAYLIAGDVNAGRYLVYGTADGNFLGSFTLAADGGIDAVTESEGIAVTTLTTDTAAPGGLFAVFDEDNDGSPGNVKLVPWAAIASALKLGSASVDPRVTAPASARVVEASVETVPVQDYGDAADDPAIWVHPTDPARSLVIGTNKKRGLDVYDLAGQRLQSVPDGRMNNVDLRAGFPLAGQQVAVVAASNRTDKSLALYRVDPFNRRLENVAASMIPTGLADPYGLCMYRSAKTGEYYVFINDSEDGAFRQWRLVAEGDRIGAEVVRDFTVGSQAEGCVADDETGALYIAEEDVGIWRYNAEPDAAPDRVAVDSTEGGRLNADVEGLGLFVGTEGGGYLVASNQGGDNYAVYRREGANEFVGFFDVVANDELGIDGVSETDGLEISSAPLGAAFPRGVFIAQDGRNISPAERQNFKLVPWERIESLLEPAPAGK